MMARRFSFTHSNAVGFFAVRSVDGRVADLGARLLTSQPRATDKVAGAEDSPLALPPSTAGGLTRGMTNSSRRSTSRLVVILTVPASTRWKR